MLLNWIESVELNKRCSIHLCFINLQTILKQRNAMFVNEFGRLLFVLRCIWKKTFYSNTKSKHHEAISTFGPLTTHPKPLTHCFELSITIRWWSRNEYSYKIATHYCWNQINIWPWKRVLAINSIQPTIKFYDCIACQVWPFLPRPWSFIAARILICPSSWSSRYIDLMVMLRNTPTSEFMRSDPNKEPPKNLFWDIHEASRHLTILSTLLFPLIFTSFGCAVWVNTSRRKQSRCHAHVNVFLPPR